MSTFDDRGVSESIGYILVFAIVLTGIAGIMFFGVTMLNDAKDRNNFQNVEQGLMVVQSDLKRVAMEKAPVKASKLHIEGGTLVTNYTAASIRVDFDGNTYFNTTGDITYRSTTGMKMLSIEGGGLWRSYGPLADEGISPPRIFSSLRNKAIVINVIRLNGTAAGTSGSGTTSLIMEYTSNRVFTYDAAVPSDVTITINTTYPNAWAKFMQESLVGFPFTPISVTDNQVKVTVSSVSEVIISEHTIDIRPFITTY